MWKQMFDICCLILDLNMATTMNNPKRINHSSIQKLQTLWYPKCKITKQMKKHFWSRLRGEALFDTWYTITGSNFQSKTRFYFIWKLVRFIYGFVIIEYNFQFSKKKKKIVSKFKTKFHVLNAKNCGINKKNENKILFGRVFLLTQFYAKGRLNIV